MKDEGMKSQRTRVKGEGKTESRRRAVKLPPGWNKKTINFAARVVRLAERGRGRVSPNPLVGALIVKNGKIITEGFHAKFGGPHAEIIALRKAGLKAKGATLYSSLEPCTVQGKTPPCADAIIAAGIRKVVYLSKDPNPAVTDTAEKVFKKGGVDCEFRYYFSAEYLNQGFAVWIRKHRPMVFLKAAVSIDGRIADHAGRSKGLGDKLQLRLTHGERKNFDALLIGAGTILADDPQLTTRQGWRHPYQIRVILDRKLTVPAQARIFSTLKKGPVWIVCEPELIGTRKAFSLKQAGAELLPIRDLGRTFIPRLLKILGKQGVTSVMVEGGSVVMGRFLESNQFDEGWLCIMPILLGDKGIPLVRLGNIDLLSAPRVKFSNSRPFELMEIYPR